MSLRMLVRLVRRPAYSYCGLVARLHARRRARPQLIVPSPSIRGLFAVATDGPNRLRIVLLSSE
jgi:hypothetical protein